MKKIILFSSIALASGVLFANIFNSVVISEAAKSDIPDSVIAARAYFKTVTPGDFFKIISPATQVITLFSIILFWNYRKVRFFLWISLLCYISGDIFAFTYFHPRNEIIYLSEPIPDNETLTKLLNEWSRMNWVRSFILFVGLAFSFLALDKSYKMMPKVYQRT